MIRLILYPRTRDMTRLRGCELLYICILPQYGQVYIYPYLGESCLYCVKVHYSPPRLHRCIVSSNSRQNCPFIKRDWLMLGLRVVIDMSDSMGSNRNKEGTWKGTVVFRLVITRHKGWWAQGCNYAVLYIQVQIQSSNS